jgi:hypothetical protein
MAASRSCKLIEFTGEPIPIEFRSNLRAGRDEVHASTHLHRRLILLDIALLKNPRERDRILAHEIFHFVWWKAPLLRAAYSALIQEELSAGATGEMGWSAEWRKVALKRNDVQQHSGRFRDYLCESFCDTCACFLLNIKRHPEITLRAKFRGTRGNFFAANLAGRRLKI